jgi:uncharacterized protein (TIGR00725 family)
MTPQHKLKIGVMGSASGPQIEDAHAREMARELGREIGRRGHIFINGACPGLPHDALLGAKEAGAFTIGISPAFSEYVHVNEYGSPLDNEMMIYTGQGFMERDIINIRSSDGVVFISGGIGTLNELTIAYDEGRPMGVLTSTGGISDSVQMIIEKLRRTWSLTMIRRAYSTNWKWLFVHSRSRFTRMDVWWTVPKAAGRHRRRRRNGRDNEARKGHLRCPSREPTLPSRVALQAGEARLRAFVLCGGFRAGVREKLPALSKS